MDLFSLQSIFSFIFSIYLFIFIYTEVTRKKPIIRGCKNYPFVGNLPDFIKNRHRFLDWSTEMLAGSPTNTAGFRLGGRQGIITANPLNVEHMLKTNFVNYPKGKRFLSLLEDFLGRGIFNSDGELWKVQRKIASFEFNTNSLRSFVMETVRHEIERRLIPLLKKAKENEEIICLQDILERFAFDNVCKVAFNEDPACLSEGKSGGGELSPDFARAFVDASNISAGRFMYAIPVLWKIKKLLNIGSEKRLRESISIVHDFAMKIIRSRKQGNPSSKEDLLSRFIAGDDNSDEFLRDIVISFILAGRDTTSSSLAWFFWLLSSRPDVERNILKEIKTVRSQNQSFGGTFSFDELREMHYLQASISEALRLYPPVAVNSKLCREDDVMPDGTFVGKGWIVNYNAYAMGRMEGIWGKDCREFKPDRWLDNGNYRPANPYRFPAFQAGPRICLGKEMAYIQMKSIAATVIESFVIDVLDKDTCPEKVLSLTLRMKGGLPIRVRERCVDVGG